MTLANLSAFQHTSIFVGSTSLLQIHEILIVYDHTEAGRLAVQLILHILQTMKTFGHSHTIKINICFQHCIKIAILYNLIIYATYFIIQCIYNIIYT